MHLAIDIGNTSVKFALFDEERMTEKGAGIEKLAQVAGQNTGKISQAIMTSVADSAAAIDLLRKFNIPLTIVNPQTPLPIRNLYRTPETLGTDRIALAVAADRLFAGTPALVIGAGTCITYDFVDQGLYAGGAISPGVTMRFRALHHFTARLPYVDWMAGGNAEASFPERPGTDTQESILIGVLSGVIKEIEGTIEQYKRRYSGLRVALTGGDMAFLVKNLKNDIFARPDMVLEGLNYILLHHA